MGLHLGVKRTRIDSRMVEIGLVESRARAQALIMAGSVTLNGQVEQRAAAVVKDEDRVEIAESLPYVSRGGEKLARALDVFNIEVKDKTILDVGASTGGFTDCVLKRGACKVYAVDVGYNQLDFRLRRDPRVICMERVNARYPFEMPEQADLATFDCSFISVRKVLANVMNYLRAPRISVILFKPQFEAEPAEVGKGGIIRDPQVHARVLGRFITWLALEGYRLHGITRSPIKGSSGNTEFLACVSDW